MNAAFESGDFVHFPTWKEYGRCWWRERGGLENIEVQ